MSPLTPQASSQRLVSQRHHVIYTYDLPTSAPGVVNSHPLHVLNSHPPLGDPRFRTVIARGCEAPCEEVGAGDPQIGGTQKRSPKPQTCALKGSLPMFHVLASEQWWNLAWIPRCASKAFNSTKFDIHFGSKQASASKHGVRRRVV